jgi:hypothetical protein
VYDDVVDEVVALQNGSGLMSRAIAEVSLMELSVLPIKRQLAPDDVRQTMPKHGVPNAPTSFCASQTAVHSSGVS